MKKVVIIFCLLFLASCSNNQTISTTETIPTIQPEITENIPTNTPLNTPQPTIDITTTKPYEFSTFYETDFSLMDSVVPNGPCSGDMTIEMCIDYYGTKSAIPDGISVGVYDEDDDYRYYVINNTLTGNSVEVRIAKGMYDSQLSDVQYSLNEDNDLIISFFFDYDQDLINDHSDSYDISQRYSQSGGPIYSHTIYHLIENNGFQMNGKMINSNDHFTLLEEQNTDLYLQSIENIEYAKIGLSYLESCDLINLVQ